MTHNECDEMCDVYLANVVNKYMTAILERDRNMHHILTISRLHT